MWSRISVLIKLFVLLAIICVVGGFSALHYFSRGIPDYQQLETYELPVSTRVYASDGKLVNEYAKEHRTFIPIKSIPKQLIDAFVAAEDKNFYSHPGVDIQGIIRAGFKNIKRLGSGQRLVGASTITQQVARNFLLSDEVSFKRKIREAILAFRIEKVISKERIMELYLNKIYLGRRSHGVAAAALNYFNKSLNELTLDEIAYLGALPKAPNNYHPIKQNRRAVIRRDWVLSRMLEENMVTAEQIEEAKARPLAVKHRDKAEIFRAPYFSEEVRRFVADKYGENTLYSGGLAVHTTINPKLQEIADDSFRRGLEMYDRRHGWRGPMTTIKVDETWIARLGAMQRPAGLHGWRLAVVLERSGSAKIGFEDGSTGQIPARELWWTKSHPLKAGDVIAASTLEKDSDGKKYPEGTYQLRQVPAVNGGLICMDVHTGRILAMTGGYSYDGSQFIRPTQAMRQIGSTFKPFVYVAALENGFSPVTKVLDAPIALPQGPGQPLWRPRNYAGKFLGPTLFRVGLEKSRNVMTVRIAARLGIETVAPYPEKFGIVDKLQPHLATVLGADETTLLRVVRGFAMFANGGKWIDVSFVDRIQNRNGRTIYRHDKRDCRDCMDIRWQGQEPPVLPDIRRQINDPASTYQMASILEGAVQRGTGRILNSIPNTIGAKTGTTNDFKDGWMIAFTADIAVGAYVGFDQPKTLGSREAGGRVAGPIIKYFLQDALKGVADKPFPVPPEIRLVRINRFSGRPATGGDTDAIWEAFKPGDKLLSDYNASSFVEEDPLDFGFEEAAPEIFPDPLPVDIPLTEENYGSSEPFSAPSVYVEQPDPGFGGLF